jgi:hypothetical protein
VVVQRCPLYSAVCAVTVLQLADIQLTTFVAIMYTCCTCGCLVTWFTTAESAAVPALCGPCWQQGGVCDARARLQRHQRWRARRQRAGVPGELTTASFSSRATSYNSIAFWRHAAFCSAASQSSHHSRCRRCTCLAQPSAVASCLCLFVCQVCASSCAFIESLDGCIGCDARTCIKA